MSLREINRISACARCMEQMTLAELQYLAHQEASQLERHANRQHEQLPLV